MLNTSWLWHKDLMLLFNLRHMLRQLINRLRKACSAMAVTLCVATAQVLIATSSYTDISWRCLAFLPLPQCRDFLVLLNENIPVCSSTCKSCNTSKRQWATVGDTPKVRASARTRLQAATVFNVVVKITVATATLCRLERKENTEAPGNPAEGRSATKRKRKHRGLWANVSTTPTPACW